MTEQLAYTLLAASTGFIAATFFCFGSAFLKQKTIIDLVLSYWIYNPEQVRAVVSQSAQYLVGGLLLIVSFVLQVVAVLASPTNLIWLHPVLLNPCVFVLLSLVLIGSMSFGLYKLLLRKRLPKIHRKLEELKTKS